MKLNLRSFTGVEDYWRLRDFLRQVTLSNRSREFSWPVMRLDYWWWFANPFIEKIDPAEQVLIWETANGRIAAALNPENRGQAFPQIHPDFKTSALEDEMIALAEERIAVCNPDGRRRLFFWTWAGDQSMTASLARRGFRRVQVPGEAEVQHRRSLDAPLPDVPATPGYTLRALGDGLELLERCYASGLGFHEDDIATARENRDHPEWYHGIQSAPLYRRDLDLVAVAADGSIASFCTIWFDDVTRTAYFEPIATVPAHRRRGLGKALMVEGLHRLKRMGCSMAFVSGYSERANGLYFSVMGPEHDIYEPWEKLT